MSEFDRYAGTYRDEVARSISFSGQGPEFFVAEKAKRLLEIVERHVGDPAELSALDVGCGVGLTDGFLGSFGELHGVDVSADVVAEAAHRNPERSYAAYEGDRLPFPAGRFDVAFAICVVHHVPPGAWSAFAAELARVVRCGGLVAVFEHNPLNPLTRLAVSRCEFDENATLLGASRLSALLRGAGLRLAEHRHMLFFPWGGRFLGALDRRLGRVPLGAQHYAAAVKP